MPKKGIKLTLFSLLIATSVLFFFFSPQDVNAQAIYCPGCDYAMVCSGICGGPGIPGLPDPCDPANTECSCYCPDPSCFPPGTKVETEGGMSKNIENVGVGDKVVSQNKSGEKVISTVYELENPISNNMCQIDFEDGNILRLTKNHPMSTVEGWKAIDPDAANTEIRGINATQLQSGDEIKKFDGSVGTVNYFSCWSEQSQTYNLKLEGDVNTYFADDYLAHNKGCPCGWTATTECKKSCNPNQREGDCSTATVTKYECRTGSCNVCPTPAPVTCTMTTEANTYSVDVGSRVQFRATVTTDPANSAIDRVQFRCRIVSPLGDVTYETCDQSSIVSLNKNGDTTEPYAAMVTGVAPGTQRVRAQAIINGASTCQDSKVFTVNPTPSPTPTCNPVITVSKNSIYPNESSVITVNPKASPSPAAITVKFSLSSPNPQAAWSINKQSDSTWQYTVNLTGTSPGSSKVLADVYINNSALPICSKLSPPVTVVIPGAWWQVRDADVTVPDGGIRVRPPDGKYYGNTGGGGYTGIPVAQTQVDVPVGKLSQDTSHDWKVETATTDFAGIYDYQHFKDSAPSDIEWNELSSVNQHPDLATGGVESNGYYWYRSTDGLTINDTQSLGSRNVVLFVEGGDLYINANIRVTKSTSDTIGSFVVFSKGNIWIDHNVTGAPSLDGLYLTDGSFNTGGTSITNEKVSLRIWGSVVALGGISLERDLDTNNVNAPAEFFRFAPDQILLFPPQLKIKKTKWNEISP